MRKESLELLQRLEDLTDKKVMLEPQDESLIKTTFKKILESGDTYNVRELADWFATNSENVSEKVIERMVNIAHYQKSKFDSANKFKMVSDDNECSCGSCGH